MGLIKCVVVDLHNCLISCFVWLLFFLYTSGSGVLVFSPHNYPVFLFSPSAVAFLCCRQTLEHRRWEQALVQLVKEGLTPRKTLGKEERDTSPVECYGFAKIISSRQSADSNWETSGGSCRITSYFVPMLMSHKIKKTHLFPANFECVAFSFSIWILGSLCIVWNTLAPCDFLSVSPGSYTWKWRHLWIYFFSMIYT